ncbi:MAG: hypothetical protein ACK5N0_06550 [Synechococcaceae cyanobacterium]
MNRARRPEPRRPHPSPRGPQQERPLTAREKQELACRLRLADSRPQRWAWALGSSLPLLGLPVLLLHGVSRRTVLPALFGISSVAMSAFAFLTLVAVLRQPGDPPPQNQEAPLLLLVGGMACFAVGHRLGQDRAADNALKWLALDR